MFQITEWGPGRHSGETLVSCQDDGRCCDVMVAVGITTGWPPVARKTLPLEIVEAVARAWRELCRG